MPEIPKPFKLTWNINVFYPAFFVLDKPLKSRQFTIDFLDHSIWRLQVVRQVVSGVDSIALMLTNECPSTCVVAPLQYMLKIISGSNVIHSQVHTLSRSQPGDVFRIPFTETNNPLFMASVMKNLSFILEISRCGPTSVVRYNPPLFEDFESLSSDMAELYHNPFYSDLTLRTNDYRTFRVHKFVIASRRFETIDLGTLEDSLDVNGVDGAVLDVYLRYMYSGKLRGRDMSLQLFTFASKNSADLRLRMLSLPSELTLFTPYLPQQKRLVWHISSWATTTLPLFRMIPIEKDMGSRQLMINIGTVLSATGEKYLDISFWFSPFESGRCMNVVCSISVTTTMTELKSATCLNMFSQNQEWHYPPFIKEDDIANLPNFDLNFTLDMVKHDLISTVVDSRSDFLTGSQTVCSLRILSDDLKLRRTGNIYFDLKVALMNGETHPAHKAILGARSIKLLSLLADARYDEENKVTTLEIRDAEHPTITHILHYIYTGTVEALPRNDVIKLRNLCEVLGMRGLKESCTRFLNRDPSN